MTPAVTSSRIAFAAAASAAAAAAAWRHDRLDGRDLDLGRAQRSDRRREADDRPEQRAEEREKGGARDARTLALGKRRVFAEGHGRPPRKGLVHSAGSTLEQEELGVASVGLTAALCSPPTGAIFPGVI